MSTQKAIEPLGEAFANGVVTGDWAAIHKLLSESERAGIPDNAAEGFWEKKFGWERLEPLLRASWSAATGQEDNEDPLDPPAHFEVYECEGPHEYSPEPVHRIGLTNPVSRQKVRWLKVYFLPDEDSGYDQCYRCYLCVVDDLGEPKIAGAIVEIIVD